MHQRLSYQTMFVNMLISRWADTVTGVCTVALISVCFVVSFWWLFLTILMDWDSKVQATHSKMACSVLQFPPSTLPDRSARSTILPSFCKTSAVCPDRPLPRNTSNLCLSFLPHSALEFRFTSCSNRFLLLDSAHMSSKGALNEMIVFQGKYVDVTPAYDVNGLVLSPRGIFLKQMVACVAKVVGSVTFFLIHWGVL